MYYEHQEKDWGGREGEGVCDDVMFWGLLCGNMGEEIGAGLGNDIRWGTPMACGN